MRFFEIRILGWVLFSAFKKPLAVYIFEIFCDFLRFFDIFKDFLRFFCVFLSLLEIWRFAFAITWAVAFLLF